MFVSRQLRKKVGGRSDFLHREEIFVCSVNGSRDCRAQSVEIGLVCEWSCARFFVTAFQSISTCEASSRTMKSSI